MNLPISWVAAAVLPASQAVKATANLASKSASQFFGNHMQADPPAAANGPSVSASSSSQSIPRSNDSTKSWNDRFESLRLYLGKVAADARGKFNVAAGTLKTNGLAITSDGQSKPIVEGPEPARTELEQHLALHPNVAKELTELAATKSNAEPLRLLPNRQPSSEPSGIFKLWLD